MQVYGKPLVYLDNAASAQKPQAVLDRLHQAYTLAIRQRASRPALPRQRGDRGLRGRARKGGGVPQRQAQGRDHLHPQRHRGDQPRRLHLRPRAHQAGRRDRALDHGAPFQHRAVAFPARAPGRGASSGRRSTTTAISSSTSSRSCSTPRTKLVAITHMSNMLGTLVPVKEVARIAHARGIPVLIDGAQARRASRRRRPGHRLRFLRLHRPQALRPDRHRRALRQIRAPRRHAAVQRRRRDDPRGVPGPRHLWRSAAQVRGRHAADRAGDRARRRDRLRRFGRQGAHPRATKRACCATPTTGCARSIRCASSAPPRTRGRSSRSR